MQLCDSTLSNTRSQLRRYSVLVGNDIFAEPMLNYSEPLLGWLRQQNTGRAHTLADL